MAMKKKFLGLALAAAVALPATGVYADTTIGGNQNDTFTHNVTVSGTVANKEGIAPEGKIEVELPTAMTFRVDQDGNFKGSDFKVQNKSKVGIDVFVDEFRTNAGGNITVKKKEELERGKTTLNRSNVYLELTGNVGGEKQTIDLAKVSETEMGKDVHHGIQNHAGCRLGRPYVRCQFHNTVRLAAEESHRSDVVQRITADRVLINLQERHFRCRPVVDDDRPRPGVGQIEKDPQEDDGRKPISRPTDVVP